jgi:cystathionine beta-lyase
MAVSPEDCWLALRGLRTLGARLAQHQQTALMLANWLKQRPEVDRVLHPALPDHPGHKLWQRDFKGASGLFSVVLKPFSDERVAAMLDGMQLFGMGFSWGGYESLMIRSHLKSARSATTWSAGGPTLRLHAGLEDPDDLIADLDAGFARLRGN